MDDIQKAPLNNLLLSMLVSKADSEEGVESLIDKTFEEAMVEEHAAMETQVQEILAKEYTAEEIAELEANIKGLTLLRL